MFLAAVLIATIVAVGVLPAFAFNDYPICIDPAQQGQARIWDDLVVWVDYRVLPGQAGSRIFAYDLASDEETQVLQVPTGIQDSADVWEDRVIWVDRTDLSEDELWMKDMSTGSASIITTAPSYNIVGPRIFGDNIVWSGNGVRYIDVTSPVLGGSVITANPLAAQVSIWEDRVVWTDERNGVDRDLFMYDLSTSIETSLVTGPSVVSSPDIWGDIVVWNQWDMVTGNDVFAMDVTTTTQWPVVAGPGNENYPEVHGDLVVWGGYAPSGATIYVSNVFTSETATVSPIPGGEQEYPALWGGTAVWEDSRLGTGFDIWGADLSGGMPITTIHGVENEWVNEAPTISLEATYAAGGFFPGSIDSFFDVNFSGITTYTAPFQVTTEGTSTIRYFSADAVGAQEDTQTAEVYLDTTPPDIMVYVDPAPVHSSDITITIIATDSLSGVAGVSYRIDGGAPQMYTAPFVVSVPGPHVITYWATDEAGNVMADVFSVTVDTMAPVADDNAPMGWVNYDYPFEINVDDSPMPSFVSIDVTVTPPPGGGSVSTETVPGDHYEYTVINNGVTTFEYTARDGAGNSSTPTVATVSLDKFVPNTTDDVVAMGWQSSDVTVTLTPDPTPSDIAATYYSVNGWPKLLYTGPFVISNEDVTDIVYWSVDNAGNVEEPKQTDTIYIDKTDPVIGTYRLPATGWASGMALAGAEANDAFSYVYRIWYSINGAPFAFEWGDVFTWLETTEGTTTVAVYAEDGAGNTSATETVTLLVDSTSPVTTDDAPASWVNTDTVVTLTASDPLSGVDETYYTIDGGAVTTYTAPILVTAEGVNTITYWSVDHAGNTEDAKSTQVKIDQTGPVVTDDSTSAWQQGPVTVTFTEADAGVDASMFYYSLDGSAEASTAASMEATGTGVHELEYYGVDSLGNAGPLGHATIRIDDDDPMSSSDIDEAWQQGPVDVTITATDAHSGVASIETTITDPPPGSGVTTSTPSDTVTFTVSLEGTTTVEYYAIDNVSNDETATAQMVRIDNTAPVVSIAPADTAAIDTIGFVVSADDPLSGVAAIYYSVDGGLAVAGTDVTVDTVGDHTVTYWAIDIAGNESAHEMHDVRVSPSETTYKEVAGANRYATAVAASKRMFPSGADAVIVATGDNWPDALGGAALAGVYDAPVLLTRKDALPDNVAGEIKRLDPMHVFVLGGTAVVSEEIEAQIRKLVVPTANLERFWGANRYITTEIIAARVTRESALFDGTAFVATGMDFPDALAAAPLATGLERPLYLAGPNGLSAGSLKAMNNAGVTDAVILGGVSAVSADVETQLDGAGVAHIRFAGVNRYATAVDVAKSGVAAGLSWDKLALASGIDFPDALSGGVMQGHDSSVMLLTPQDTLNGSVKATLKSQRDIIGEVRYIGGTNAISQSVRDEVKQVLR